ncbi:MAG TPA: ATP-binding cassette domain-containing protein [Rhizomicrobium sp.]|nr:ATP-binding cassette domain-containing protein [Rhizomicrobium sp.]
MALVVDSLRKRFGTYPALEGASFSAPQGAFVALLGPSGSGKTTLLRVLGGLEFPDTGEVRFADMNWLAVPTRERKAGFVFQNYALFRHMTAAQNIGFGLNVRPRRTRPSRKEIAQRVENLLRLVQLEDLGKRYPSQLSGGQRQRVALARALAIEPRMLLLDEPFGALDAKVRKELRVWLRGLHAQLGLTTLFVTHDQDEAFAMADLVAVMNAGKIEQFGTPQELRRAPKPGFVEDFLRIGEGAGAA